MLVHHPPAARRLANDFQGGPLGVLASAGADFEVGAFERPLQARLICSATNEEGDFQTTAPSSPVRLSPPVRRANLISAKRDRCGSEAVSLARTTTVARTRWFLVALSEQHESMGGFIG